ncbi:hypothetical protein V6N11_058739 [Hibiscus sabdariffa]|uniref:Hexosyltransferase n=1 Tax=Hibiscus sabdariffa TaxID=183260 RepID=A0ABR2U531_9ROSI
MAMLWRHPENIELEKAKVVHYCAAGSKPWRYTGKEQNMKKWWDIYNDESLDYKNVVATGKAEAHDEEQAGLQQLFAGLPLARSWCFSTY